MSLVLHFILYLLTSLFPSLVSHIYITFHKAVIYQTGIADMCTNNTSLKQWVLKCPIFPEALFNQHMSELWSDVPVSWSRQVFVYFKSHFCKAVELLLASIHVRLVSFICSSSSTFTSFFQSHLSLLPGGLISGIPGKCTAVSSFAWLHNKYFKIPQCP